MKSAGTCCTASLGLNEKIKINKAATMKSARTCCTASLGLNVRPISFDVRWYCTTNACIFTAYPDYVMRVPVHVRMCGYL